MSTRKPVPAGPAVGGGSKGLPFFSPTRMPAAASIPLLLIRMQGLQVAGELPPTPENRASFLSVLRLQQ